MHVALNGPGVARCTPAMARIGEAGVTSPCLHPRCAATSPRQVGVRGGGGHENLAAAVGFLPFSGSAHPPARRPEPQCLRRSARGAAAQQISAFSTGLTSRADAANVGGGQTAFGSLAAHAFSVATVTTRWRHLP